MGIKELTELTKLVKIHIESTNTFIQFSNGNESYNLDSLYREINALLLNQTKSLNQLISLSRHDKQTLDSFIDFDLSLDNSLSVEELDEAFKEECEEG
jgi:hypothetical protein